MRPTLTRKRGTAASSLSAPTWLIAGSETTPLRASQKRERAQYRDLPPPADFDEACARVQFLVGGADTVAREVRKLYEQIPFTHLHIQPRWKGLSPERVRTSIERFQEEVGPAAFG